MPNPMKSYELIFKKEPELKKTPRYFGLGSKVYLNNALWFIKVRWIVVAVFFIAGAIGLLFADQFYSLGIRIPSIVLFILTVILIIENLVLYIIASRLNENSPHRIVELNLWFQIVFDLLIVTTLVYYIGSIDTFIVFTYLFHITLACIFFPQRKSLFVTLLAIFFYLSNVILEITGVLYSASIFVNNINTNRDNPIVSLVVAGSAVFICLVIWYFVSTLSETVRKQDRELSKTNDIYIKTIQEKDKKALITIHDLKAPLSGIESNIQVLKYQYWKEFSGEIKDYIEKIDLRAQSLRERINDLLILGKLASANSFNEPVELLNIREMINDICENINEKAKIRKITIDIDLPSELLLSNKKKINILFNNLIANAIFYSYEGGIVNIYSEKNKNTFCVYIKDHGIGIREDALPQIFNDYYRTKEAVRFNKMSTGIGLAIVREIAYNLKLNITVSSIIEKGTTFKVIFPLDINVQNKSKEKI